MGPGLGGLHNDQVHEIDTRRLGEFLVEVVLADRGWQILVFKP